jgi:hypothetical protein
MKANKEKELKESIENYAQSLLKHNLYPTIEKARVESWKWHMKAEKGLVEPLKCPHKPDIGTTVVELEDGGKIVSWETRKIKGVESNYNTLEETFRSFIRENQLTAQWEEFIKNNKIFDTPKAIDWDTIITPLVMSKNTIVRDEMTEEEYKIANEVMTNWIEWIKQNTTPNFE